jgi:hypothetical protein
VIAARALDLVGRKPLNQGATRRNDRVTIVA